MIKNFFYSLNLNQLNSLCSSGAYIYDKKITNIIKKE